MLKKVIATLVFGSMFSVGAVASNTPVAGSEVLAVTVSKAVARGYRASKIIGMDVHNRQGKVVGTVNDLIVSGDDFVSYAIVDVGGFLGMGAKHVAVPVELFENIRGKAVLPGATEASLKRLPAFHYAY